MQTLAKNVIDLKLARRKKNLTSKNGKSHLSMVGKGFADHTMIELSNRFSVPRTEEEYRNRALFLLMSKTGLRAKEIVSLRFSQLLEAPTGETLISYIRKGGKISYAVIDDTTFQSLREYHSAFQLKSDFFFLSRPKRNQSTRNPLSTRGLQKIVNSWNVFTCSGKLAHPHAMRHTVGHRLLKTVGSIGCQKVLQHSSPVTSSLFYTPPYFDGSKYLSWGL
ncbi:site-specific recombinase, phage integrase family [Leptospira broomii serovar Hurstbridge str. 5399]|uniref:Site-specific recombinase, phage integrase family n=1 Tax=Leptospira broomii serovar Hurstbridge str. 5399 TaxID=1049789 RepID=T0GEV7_9LEPT|nr:tyrosine-type recombinase/integrase [Leptospira broomii]EQA43938.1 site-specific recombinase, phage integrase family [Leptospira broomii serovar Hurstbridge str. 5399]